MPLKMPSGLLRSYPVAPPPLLDVFAPLVLDTRCGLIMAIMPETSIAVSKIVIARLDEFTKYQGMRWLVAKDLSWEPQVRAVFARMCAGTITAQEVYEF